MDSPDPVSVGVRDLKNLLVIIILSIYTGIRSKLVVYKCLVDDDTYISETQFTTGISRFIRTVRGTRVL